MFLLALVASVAHSDSLVIPQPKHISAIQILIREDNPGLHRRAQNIIENRFWSHVERHNLKRNMNIEKAMKGREMDFFLIAYGKDDLFEQAADVDRMMRGFVKELEGKVRTRGRFFYATTNALLPTYLETKVENGRVTRIRAKRAPFVDLVKQIQSQVPGMNYMVSGDCSSVKVDVDIESPHGIAVSKVIQDLSSKNGLEAKWDSEVLYIQRALKDEDAFEFFPYPFVQIPSDRISGYLPVEPARIPRSEPQPLTQVYFPLPPLGE